MARVTLNPQKISRAGLIAAYTAVTSADGAQFRHGNQQVFLHCKNTTGSTITLTFITSQMIDDLPVNDLQVTLGANQQMFFGPFPMPYAQDDGNVWLNVSANGVQAAALHIFPLS